MAKSATKHIDEAIAADIGLLLSNLVATIKHVQRLDKLVVEFLFAFEKDGVVYYDRVPSLRPDNGMRCKIVKFQIQPSIRDRLNKHLYKRWYVRSANTLYVMQTAKPGAIDEYFYFVDAPTPGYRTQTAYTEPETFFIRKKPLVQCRAQHPGWGGELLKSIKVQRRAQVA